MAQAPWSDQAMLRRARECVLPSITRDEPIQAWIIDDTGFPKKGSHSVSVARQYCGLVVNDFRRDCAIRTGMRRAITDVEVTYDLDALEFNRPHGPPGHAARGQACPSLSGRRNLSGATWGNADGEGL